MPRLKEVDINYDQICELVGQLDIEKKMDLIREVTKERDYKKSLLCLNGRFSSKV